MNADLGAFKHIKVINQQNHKYLLQIPVRFEHFVNDSSNGASNMSNGDEYCYYLIDHQRDQFPYREGQADRTVADYCHSVIMTIVKILSVIQEEAQSFIVE